MSSSNKLNIIISGGGTGGHIFPAISIANAIKEIVPHSNILFVGAKGKMEMEKVPKAGYDIKGLWISGIQRGKIFKNISFPFKLIHSLISSFFIIKSFKPHAAVGVGGYASGPLLKMASVLGVPSLIQEQNSFPGITNKILSKTVDKICVVFEGMEKYFPKEKITIVGNPVRQDIVKTQITSKEGKAYFNLDQNKKTVFITGGSLGAGSINKIISQNINHFLDKDIQLIWQCGKGYYTNCSDGLKSISRSTEGIVLKDFIQSMPHAYAAADLIVSRAGGVIAELCIVGKAAILVPSPYVAEDHQTYNARSLVDKGAALLIKDDALESDLINTIDQLLSNEEMRNEYGGRIKELAKPNASNEIAHLVLNMIAN